MRVIVVDDDQLVEMSLTTILGWDEEIEPVIMRILAHKTMLKLPAKYQIFFIQR